jgi:hypothetical protein
MSPLAARVQSTPASAPPPFIARERLRRIDELEEELHHARDAVAFHSALGFYSLLTVEDRERLEHIFDDNPIAPPTPGTTAELRAVLDARARAYLTALLGFGRDVQRGRLELVERLHADDPAGASLLTMNASRVDLGPPDRAGVRSFEYRPIRAHDIGEVTDRVRLEHAILVGERVDLGALTVSRLVVSTATRSSRSTSSAGCC